MGILETVAEDVKTLIDGAVIDYVPEYELKDFKAEKIVIIPVGLQYNNLTRGSKEIMVNLEIGICKRIKESEVSTMLDRVQTITETLLNAPLVNTQGYCKSITNAPAYSLEALVQEQKFLSVLQVQYRVL